MKISIIGGTGYAGTHLVTEAHARGHAVTAISRSAPAHPTGGITYLTGDALDEALLARTVEQVNVVISSLSPRGALAGRTRGVLARLAGLSAQAGARFGVVGGAGSLLLAEGGPRVMDTDAVPEEFKAEAQEMGEVLTDLRSGSDDVDWFYISPAAGFGPWAAGTKTGTYRTGADILLTDDQGRSLISGADLAHAVLDEVESPAHRRARFTVAY